MTSDSSVSSTKTTNQVGEKIQSHRVFVKTSSKDQTPWRLRMDRNKKRAKVDDHSWRRKVSRCANRDKCFAYLVATVATAPQDSTKKSKWALTRAWLRTSDPDRLSLQTNVHAVKYGSGIRNVIFVKSLINGQSSYLVKRSSPQRSAYQCRPKHADRARSIPISKLVPFCLLRATISCHPLFENPVLLPNTSTEE